MKKIKVKDILPKEESFEEITLVVISKGSRRLVRTRYGEKSVCDVLCTDDTGKINLTLWENQIDLVNPGTKVRIRNGWINVWKNMPKITIGKGKMEILETEQTNLELEKENV